MKTAASQTLNTITNDYHNSPSTTVYAEWNMNRYYRTVVDNTPSEDSSGYDIEMFPIESIVLPNRPVKSGICKAVVGQATVANNSYVSDVPAKRFYTASPDDEYKYWQSPEPSAVSTGSIANCAPQVAYVEEADVSGSPVGRTVKTNKIVFTVENSFAYPTEYTVQIKLTPAASWSTVATNVSIPSSGRVELFHQGSGVWSTTPKYDQIITAHAVRLVITKLNVTSPSYFNLIELGFRLHVDVSKDVESWSDSFNMGEVDFVTPLGTISSNEGDVTLYNEDGRYKNDNPNSDYYGILDKGVKFTCFVNYGSDSIREFTLYSDSWEETLENTTISLIDQSKFFMETKVRPVLYQNISIQEAIWRICDIIGFNNYNVSSLDANSKIDIFWTDPDVTAWETLSKLAKETQTAIYFDSYGVLQIKTRDTAWGKTQSVKYNLIEKTVPGGQPSNIVKFDTETSYEANKVTVNYKPTGFSEKIDNIIPFETVWEPEGTVVLRATPIVSSMNSSQMTIHLGTAGKDWPFTGIMQIEGEWITYDAKQYTYYEATVKKNAWVTSLEEQQKYDAITGEYYRQLNSYTGQLRIKERGAFNTEAKAHNISITANGWNAFRQKNYGTPFNSFGGFKVNPGQSSMTIDTPRTSTVNQNFYHYLVRGGITDEGFKYLGTRLKINKTGHNYKAAGIFFNGGAVGTGYFLEVMPSQKITGEVSKTRKSVILYSMKSDGSKQIIGGDQVTVPNPAKNAPKGSTIKTNVGVNAPVIENNYANIDIYFTDGATQNIKVYFNGGLIIDTNVTGTWKQASTGRFGLFARGQTSVTFDYVYAVNISASTDVPTVESFFDRIESSWVSNQWQKDWAFQTKEVRRKIRKKWTKITVRYNQRLFEEFGPVAHEVREFKVKFTSATPVLQSRLFFTNTTQALVTEYTGDISGAKFIVANFHRSNAVVNGDDTLTFPGETVNQKLLVTGRPVIQKDSKKVERTDAAALRRRGPIEVEYESTWIQNETAATALGDWLATHWSTSDENASAEIFGNPLIELTDLVSVKHGFTDGNFYVTGVSNSWDNGLTTNLKLRKV